MAYPLVNILHLRSFTQDEVPVNLESGQIALNLYSGNNALANGTYNVSVFIGTGGTERKAVDGTDLTGDALARAVVTGEPLGVNNGWIRFDLGDLYTPTPGLNLDAAGVTSKKGALDTLDALLGFLPNLTTTDKTSIVNAINELVTTIGPLVSLTTVDKTSIVNAINEIDSFVKQLTSGLQYVGTFNPNTDTIASVSSSGVREGYVVGPLPTPTDATERHFFIASANGTLSGTGNTPSGDVLAGDWIISNGAVWEVLNYENKDPIVSSAVAPSPTLAGPLWMDTTATDPLGGVGKLHFWNGTAWHQLVSDVADGGAF